MLCAGTGSAALAPCLFCNRPRAFRLHRQRCVATGRFGFATRQCGQAWMEGGAGSLSRGEHLHLYRRVSAKSTSQHAFSPNSPVMHYSSYNHFLPQILEKHKRLLSAAPGSTLDCGALHDPPMLLSALEHASSSPEGSAFCFARFRIAPVGLLPLSEMPCSLRVARHMPHTWYSCRGQDNRRVVESTLLRPYSSSFTAAAQVQDAG